ncbi:MAG: hypothetical protein R3174_02355 [Gammaproteobacteria bacterium]|nr:hypothetical protein [Gammaproteobacteria bacterium]
MLPSVLLAEELALTSDDDLSVFERVATLSVCFDFGCKRRQDVHIHTPEWRGIEELLANRPDPAAERESIARAVAYMERIVGTMSPTGRDRGGNEYREDDEPGQMDCIDESTNTTAYLSLFEERGLLEWHRVMDPVYRAPQILDQHWAARIEEVATGSQFAVDSWPGDNGEPPLIQRVDAWLKKLALDGEWRR